VTASVGGAVSLGRLVLRGVTVCGPSEADLEHPSGPDTVPIASFVVVASSLSQQLFLSPGSAYVGPTHEK